MSEASWHPDLTFSVLTAAAIGRCFVVGWTSGPGACADPAGGSLSSPPKCAQCFSLGPVGILGRARKPVDPSGSGRMWAPLWGSRSESAAWAHAVDRHGPALLGPREGGHGILSNFQYVPVKVPMQRQPGDRAPANTHTAASESPHSPSLYRALVQTGNEWRWRAVKWVRILCVWAIATVEVE
jgi:hypothetical protein